MAESNKKEILADNEANSINTTQHHANEIWIYGDLRNQSLFDTSLNLLCGAKTIALTMSSERVFVIALFKDSLKCNYESGISREIAIKQAFDYGADKILVVNFSDGDALKGEILDSYLLPETIAKALSDIVQKKNPKVFLFPLNDISREISARCAFLCHAGMIADCKYLKYAKNEIVAVCPSHGGEIMAELGFSNPLNAGFITVQPNAFKEEFLNIKKQKEQHHNNECANHKQERIIETVIETVNVDMLSYSSSNIKPLFVRKEKTEGQNLENADKVVVGGAGVGNIEGFRSVRRLAASLGAQIGATRPPVLWHWTDDDRLIGQTGKTIKPELLISVGTSGAVQYTAGITESKTIVVVNKDPNATIFKFADIGIVEDAAIFIPILTDKIQKIVLRTLADTLVGDDIRVKDSDKSDKDEINLGAANNEQGEKGADFGSKLMRIRKAHQFSLEELAKHTGKSPEFIEELENNRTTPSVGFMIKLSEVFGIDPETFLNDDERATLSGKRAKEYIRRTGNYYYQNLTPGAENEHLRVFMVTIESNKKHKPVAYRHEGEEFIYVMEGTLELTLDGKVHKLISGESIKFHSETPHQLKSLGTEDTRCLVTLYTP